MKKKICLFSLILFIIDLGVKLIIKNTLNLNESIVIIPNFFNFNYVINTGAAFSILEGKQIFLILLALALVICLVKTILKENLNNYKIYYYSLLFGGILGNVFDRLAYNGVIDFLAFKIFNYEAPIFNLADVFIVIGTSLIIIEMFLPKK